MLRQYVDGGTFPFAYGYAITSRYNIQNGNMLDGIDTVRDYSGPLFWLFKYQFQYDDKVNPLYSTTLPALNPIFLRNIHLKHIYQERQNANNVTVKQYDEDDPNFGHAVGIEKRKYSCDGKVL